MTNDWYNDIPELMTQTDRLYERIAAKWPEKTKLALTKEKMIVERKWQPSLPLIKRNLDRVLEDFQCFYLPKNLVPGPLFVFPVRGTDGAFRFAQSKPLEGSVLFGKHKYRYIGNKPYEPIWLGNDPATIQRVIETRTALAIEGGFDTLACRLLMPDAPIMSPLTKRLGDKHIAYLRMLGVKRLFLMFDFERAKQRNLEDSFEVEEYREEGQGEIAMAMAVRKIKDMEVIPVRCDSSDPSEALESAIRADKLRKTLLSLFSTNEDIDL